MEELCYSALDIAAIIGSMGVGCRAQAEFLNRVWEKERPFLQKDYRDNKRQMILDDPGGEQEDVPSQRPRKKQGKREEDLSGLPVIVVEHSMTQEELAARFGEDGFKQLPDEVYRRYRFTPAKIEVEEHHVKVYAGKKTEEVMKAPHQECLLTGSLVSPSLEAAVMNAKIEKITDEMYHMAGGAQSYSSLVCFSVSFSRNSSAA